MIMIMPIGHDHDYANRSSITSILLLELPVIFAVNEHRDEILTHPIECVGHVVKSVDMGVPKYRCWIWTVWGSTGWKKFTKFITIIRIFSHLFYCHVKESYCQFYFRDFKLWRMTANLLLAAGNRHNLDLLFVQTWKYENMKISHLQLTTGWQQPLRFRCGCGNEDDKDDDGEYNL